MLAIYLKELITWNKKFNLTAITNPEEIKVKHFEDSLTILQSIHLTTQSVVDIGAGAGFPGIPLKIECPGIKLTLVEATKKKVKFLKHLIALLNLTDTEAVWARAEKLNQAPAYKGKYDVAVARAVAKLDLLIAYAFPFLKPGGLLIAQKGPNSNEEIQSAAKVLNKFGGKIKEIKRIKLSNGDERSLIFIVKS